MAEAAFSDLPQRIFLDSSTLQTLHDYGSYFYENESLSDSDPIRRDKQGNQKLEALRQIMAVAERAPFQFALSKNSFAEVARAGSKSYLQWAYDVLDHWLVCVSESGAPQPPSGLLAKLQSPSFN